MKTKQKLSKIVIHPASIGMLVENTWNFAHNILWLGKSLSHEETTLIKSYIREYYEEIPANKFRKKALQHHQRICRYVLVAKGNGEKNISHPCIWFNALYPDGLAGMWNGNNSKPNKIINS
jgi:hypothetical protein